MFKLNSFLALIICLIAATATVFAQEDRDDQGLQRVERQTERDARPQRLGIGAALDMHQLHNDIQSNSTYFFDAKIPFKIGGQLLVDYNLLKLGRFAKLNLRGSAGYFPIEVSAARTGSEATNPGYKATNNVINFDISIQPEFFPRSRLRPFAFAGIGFQFFDPKREYDPSREPNFAPYVNSNDKSSVSIPIGAGLKYTAGNNVDIFASFHKIYNFSDNLDGWVSEINDNIPVIALGALIYFGGEEEEEIKVEPVVLPPAVVETDTDGDGLLDNDERTIYKTDPTNKDTDGDGCIDGEEVKTYRTDPLKKDTDADRLNDCDEILTYKTDPLKKDTDGDGCLDGDEVIDMKTDPLKVDTDGDALTDCDERNIYRTNPLVKDTDGDGADDGLEVRNGTNPLKADVLNIDETGRIVLEGINFRTNKYEILPESEEILMKAYNTLRTNPTIKVEIGGHTDDVGKDKANQILSENRAKAVRTWLTQKGIDPGRVSMKGYGEMSPLVPNTSPENRAKNRRIEFTITSR